MFEVDGKTVGECLDDLVRLHLSMKKALFYECGGLDPHVKVQVNNESAGAEGLAKTVKDGDKIHIKLKTY